MKRLWVVGLLALALFGVGCRRNRVQTSTKVWLGPNGGCVESKGFLCWDETHHFAAPMPPKPGTVLSVSLSATNACGLFTPSAVVCWDKAGKEERLEDGDEVATSGTHTCIRSGTKLRCFGANDEGQLGGDWGAVKTMALGPAHTCAAQADRVLCAGRNATEVPGPVRQIVAGESHTCVLRENWSVQCWGKNDEGQLGDGTTKDSLTTPVNVSSLQGVAQIAAGARHTCALLGNGTVACWGTNKNHELSNGTTERSSQPAIVVGLVQVRQLTAAGSGSCVKLDGGHIRCWGRNDKAQLGDGSGVEHSVPAPIKYR